MSEEQSAEKPAPTTFPDEQPTTAAMPTEPSTMVTAPDEPPVEASATVTVPDEPLATATVPDQPPAQTRAPHVDLEGIRARRARVRELVPSIGHSWRWYDIPYRLCSWLLRRWPRRLLSWRARRRVNRWLNFFIAFNEIDRAQVEALDDPLHNLVLPDDERVQQGGVWVVELFRERCHVQPC